MGRYERPDVGDDLPAPGFDRPSPATGPAVGPSPRGLAAALGIVAAILLFVRGRRGRAPGSRPGTTPRD